MSPLRSAAVWGFVGLGLAVVGTILGCIPVVPVIVPGMLLLFAALVVSIVALFVKNTAKWPAIVGLALSVVGGIIAVFVLIGTLVFAAYEALPTGGSTPGSALTPSSEPTPSAEATAEGRPSPEEIAAAMQRDAAEESLDGFDYDDPEFGSCFGQYMYDSELSDLELQLFVAGDEYAPTDEEYQRISATGAQALVACE